ncbi:tannase/feruloyl esterase family alpha/beta hydrolase [Caulobacter segnis]
MRRPGQGQDRRRDHHRRQGDGAGRAAGDRGVRHSGAAGFRRLLPGQCDAVADPSLFDQGRGLAAGGRRLEQQADGYWQRRLWRDPGRGRAWPCGRRSRPATPWPGPTWATPRTGPAAPPEWALGQPEKIIDWGHRANHETAVFAKALIAAHYGKGPRRAYFTGCSDGGREALMEVQRYPGDFDGVVAGAPANAWTRLMGSFAWSWKAVHEVPESRIPDALLPVVQKAALAQCDKLDGVADGVIEDPRRCRFDPAVVHCKDGQAKDCLTPAQVSALRKLYQGPRGARGKAIFPGYPAGGEATPGAWPLWISGEKAQHPSFARSFFANFVYANTSWQLAQLNLDKDLKAARAIAPTVASDNPDLSAFKAKGGKLILFHGWSDAAITPLATIQYYDAVRARMGTKSTDAFSRLFMVPGMSHCFGGPGPNSFDMLATLDAWVEGGRAPDTVIASKLDNDYADLLGMPAKTLRTRPLCAYPKVAQWDGKGSTDQAASFSCLRSARH